MKERPILFTGPMVRAILEGRKTQTRRLSGLENVNTYPGSLSGDSPMGPLGYRGLCPSDYYLRDKKAYARSPELYHWLLGQQSGELNPIPIKCPYGKTGDRLWVRETWGAIQRYDLLPPTGIPIGSSVGYAATADISTWCQTGCDGAAGKWRPSIFMPRWASRISLEITGVRVERLQSISAADIEAEGIGESWWPESNLKAQWEKGWDKINGKRAPWESNPWVWVIEFKKHSS